MPAADTRRLHGPARRQIRRTKAHAVHAGARRRNFRDIIDALRRLQKRVDHDRLLDPVLGFELRQQLIEIVNVPRTFDLWQHDDVELAAGGAHDLQDIIENPRAVQRVDAGPKAGLAELVRAGQFYEAFTRGFLVLDWNRVFQIPQITSTCLISSGTLARIFSTCGATKWIMRSRRTGFSTKGAGALAASAL